MSEHMSPIPSRIYNASVGGHVCGAVDIIDDALGLEQSSINEDVAPMPYNDGNPNGMGRIILKKTDNFKNVVEAQSGNTIFIIKYDFTLTGDVTIPANCILDFQGGSISGAYTITGNNTGIQAGLVKIFNTDVTLAGTWNVTEAYPEWFGAKGNGISDDRLTIQKTIDSFITVKLGCKTYLLNSYTDKASRVHSGILQIKNNTHIIGFYGKSVLKIGDYFDDKSYLVITGFNAENREDFEAISNIEISNIVLDFNQDIVQMRSQYFRCIGIELGIAFYSKISFCIFRNGDLSQAISAGWNGEGDNLIISHCKFINLIAERDYTPDGYENTNKDHSTIYTAVKNIHIDNCLFYQQTKHSKRIACAIEIHNSDAVINNNTVFGYARGHFIAPTESGFTIENVYIQNNNYNVTNYCVHFWSITNSVIRNINILGNICEHNHNLEDGTMYSNGAQNFITTTNPTTGNATLENIYIKGNIAKVGNIVSEQQNQNLRHVLYLGDISVSIQNINIENNRFYNFEIGFEVSKDSMITNFVVINNIFDITRFFNIAYRSYMYLNSNVKITNVKICNNVISFFQKLGSPRFPIELESTTIEQINIIGNIIPNFTKQTVSIIANIRNFCNIDSETYFKLIIDNNTNVNEEFEIAHNMGILNSYDSSITITFFRSDLYELLNNTPFFFHDNAILSLKKRIDYEGQTATVYIMYRESIRDLQLFI